MSSVVSSTDLHSDLAAGDVAQLLDGTDKAGRARAHDWESPPQKEICWRPPRLGRVPVAMLHVDTSSSSRVLSKTGMVVVDPGKYVDHLIWRAGHGAVRPLSPAHILGCN